MRIITVQQYGIKIPCHIKLFVSMYILKNLNDALDQLDQLLCSEYIDKLKALQNERELFMYHFSVGLWISQPIALSTQN